MKNNRFVVVSDLSETPAASQSSQREATEDEGGFIILSEFPKSSGLIVPKALSKLFPAYSELKTGATPKAVDPKGKLVSITSRSLLNSFSISLQSG